MLSRFHLIPERNGQADRFAISISRVSMLTRNKNEKKYKNMKMPSSVSVGITNICLLG